MEQPTKRGGKRPGAGRPSTGVAALHCYPKRETVQRIKARANALGVTVGKVIDELTSSNKAALLSEHDSESSS